jgi:hypothetical protein
MPAPILATSASPTGQMDHDGAGHGVAEVRHDAVGEASASARRLKR